jgi:formate hydrogenlyase transcriptional activator
VNLKELMMRILIAEDDPFFSEVLEGVLTKWGYQVVVARNGKDAWQALQAEDAPRIAILDWMMPDMTGIDICRLVRMEKQEAYRYLILLTSQQQATDIIVGMDAGADDYLTKPLKINELRVRLNAGRRMVDLQQELLTAKGTLATHAALLELTVAERTEDLTRRTEALTEANSQLTREISERQRAEESLLGAYLEIKNLKDRLQSENAYLQREVSLQDNSGEIIGQSTALSAVFSLVDQVARMNATVLLLGETGTGKGVIARAIHRKSARENKPLITVNCATLPASLIESELFGREKGAFTGAHDRQIGRFELADKGTIFLDEVGELPLELQTKLLRVLQDGEFERLGSSRTLKTDVRIIAATNRNLGDAIRNGSFREDLFYRLNVFPILMPPLRQRREDVPLLVQFFLAKFNKKTGKTIKSVSKDTLKALQDYSWPGNVRELESVVERAVITSQGSALEILDRLETSREPAGRKVTALAEVEHDHILRVLLKTGWRIEGKGGAAEILGLNASTLRARIRKYGIVRK